MFDHQKSAVDKIGGLLAGALFMEMGTGKSRTAIELARRRFAKGKIRHVVWLCPVTTKFNVCLELEKHVETPSVYMFDDKTRVNKIPEADWYVVGIESVSSSARILEALEAVCKEAFVIVDESDLIKVPRALRTKRLLRIAGTASSRLIMTGTPVTNGIEDLFTQFYFLHWKILGYQHWLSFERYHIQYANEQPRRIVSRHNVGVIHAKIAPYTYQVRRSECMNLPKKIYHSFSFSMTTEQRELYERAKQEILLDEEAFTMKDVTIYRLFSALQRIVSDGTYYSRAEAALVETFAAPLENPRIICLLERLDELAEKQVVIWTKFIREMDAIMAAVAERFPGRRVLRFDGRTPEKKRGEVLREFRAGADILVINQAVGGRGIDLTSSHNAIYYSTTFKVSLRLQSEDRQHRLGQKESVVYHDLVGANSIDERIRRSQVKRIDLIEWFKDRLAAVRAAKTKAEARKLLESLADEM